MAVADQFPSAEVLGIDFTPIQPDWVPPNLRFIVDDIEQDWLNGSNYDLVHLRQVFPLLKQPETVLGHAFEYVRLSSLLRCVFSPCTADI